MTKTERVADYIADFVAAIGVEHVFLLPGGGAMHLVDAFGKNPKLRTIACLHEQAAGISAESYGRNHRSGIGVAVVTTGPGATNAITAVTGAWIDSLPILVISGQVKRSDLLGSAPLRQSGVQEVDIVRMVQGITKYAKTLCSVEDIPMELAKAYRLAMTGRPGPVWLDVPLDVQGAVAKGFPSVDSVIPDLRPGVASAQPDEALQTAVGKVISLLDSAERPVILAGHGVRISGAQEVFKEVIEQLGVPSVFTWNAMDLLPYEHPLNIGRPGVVALRAPNFAVQNSDLLISIGSRLDSVITAYHPQGFARDAKKVIVDIDQAEIAKLRMDTAVTQLADAREFLSALLRRSGEVVRERFKEWRNKTSEWKKRYPVNDGKSFGVSGAISHYQLVDALSDAIPENTVIATGSSGLAVEAFYSAFRNKSGQRIFLTSGLGAMGYGLPSAIGACFANGLSPLICVEGDGSLQLNLQELATLRSLGVPICLIVMNNGGYCSIRNTQRNYFEGRYVGTGPEAGVHFPELEALASAYRLGYARISEPRNLTEQLRFAMRNPWPMILEIQLVKDEALSPKVAALPQPDGSMLSMPLEDMSPLLPLEAMLSEMGDKLTDASFRARRVDRGQSGDKK